uniref:Uncharacterized protein n=1 Tax=Arundo donax TaxID=35708 RepID=A0A0A8YH84_ARUDO
MLKYPHMVQIPCCPRNNINTNN